MPTQLVRVKILAQGSSITMVEWNGKRWEVDTRDLTNQITTSTNEGFITYAWINRLFLQKEWK